MVHSRISAYRQIFNLNMPLRFLLPYKAMCSQVSWIRVWTSLEAVHSPRAATNFPTHLFIVLSFLMVHLRPRPVLRAGEQREAVA